jgi:hypothetical protein
METTTTNFLLFRKEKLALGWKIAETVVHENEPIFGFNGEQIDSVNVVDHHFVDGDGTPMGCFQVIENAVDGDFMEFEWDF